MKRITAIAMLLAAAPALAAEEPRNPAQPVKLTDGELDGVVAGDPLLLINVVAPVNVNVAPIRVRVDVPVNVAAVVQANVLGNATFDAIAVGTQNVFNAAAHLPGR